MAAHSDPADVSRGSDLGTCLGLSLSVFDHRGIPFDGSLVSTVDEYNREVNGDGMKYAVKAWKDR